MQQAGSLLPLCIFVRARMRTETARLSAPFEVVLSFSAFLSHDGGGGGGLKGGGVEGTEGWVPGEGPPRGSFSRGPSQRQGAGAGGGMDSE